MLPRHQRLTSPQEFAACLRRGRGAGDERMRVMVLATGTAEPARVGLIVGKRVGNAVARHRVSRQLRHVLAPWIMLAAPGTLVVVRAMEGASGASSAELATSVERLLARIGRMQRR